jgi:hypothetical protein
MDEPSFLSLVRSNGIRADAYSLGQRTNEAYGIEKDIFGWQTFYFERGILRNRKRFKSKSDALVDLAQRLDADSSTKVND